MYSLFYQCKQLKEVNFRNINTSSLENIGALFSECSNLISIDLSNFDTSKITTFNYFSNSLKIDIYFVYTVIYYQ